MYPAHRRVRRGRPRKGRQQQHVHARRRGYNIQRPAQTPNQMYQASLAAYEGIPLRDPNNWTARLNTDAARFGSLSGAAGGVRPDYAYYVNQPYAETYNPLFGSRANGEEEMENQRLRDGKAVYQRSAAFQLAEQNRLPTPFYSGVARWYECAWLGRNGGVYRRQNNANRNVYMYGCIDETNGEDVLSLLQQHQHRYAVPAKQLGILSGTHGTGQGINRLNDSSIGDFRLLIEDVENGMLRYHCNVGYLTPYNLSQFMQHYDVLILAWCFSNAFQELGNIGVVDAKTERVCDAKPVIAAGLKARAGQQLLRNRTAAQVAVIAQQIH